MIVWDSLQGLFRLFYPKCCAVCNRDLKRGEDVLCIPCLYKIPLTHFWEDQENSVAQIFWGRVTIVNACAYFYFTKGSKYRPLLHKLKYLGQQEIGTYLGQQFGVALAGEDCYSTIDMVVPVPLHSKRYKQRGYNQAECIASGIAKGLKRDLRVDCLKRILYTETQTKRTREERVRNVTNAFSVTQPDEVRGKHILLVDDVVTTGATLESCASKLLEVENCRVSIAVLAFASS